MSKKRTDTPAAGSKDDGGDDDKQTSNTSARSAIGHQAASSVAAAASSSSAAAAPTMLPSRSPAQRLYSDALISVFRFLDFAEVIAAHATCRSWRDAAHKEPSRQITLKRCPDELSWFCTSPLCRHVANFSPSRPQCTLEQFASLRAFPALTGVQMVVVPSAALASLAALRGQNGYAAALAATVAQWPSSLTHFESLSSGWRYLTSWAQAQAWMDCIGGLRLLTYLKIELPDSLSERITLQPLLQLTALHSLHLNGYDSVDAADCSVVKQMRLTRLSLESPNVTVEAIQALCTPPHQLAGLKELELRNADLVAAHVEALLGLPALSTLKPSMCLDAVALLPRFSHLRTLDLLVEADAASDFMQPLTECKQLTELTLRWCPMTLHDLGQLTRSLTELTVLRLFNVEFEDLDESNALSCLRHLKQLRDLRFMDCAGVRLEHLTDAAFTSLSSLRSLDVCLSDSDALDAREAFALPCAMMPSLEQVRIRQL